MRGPSLWTVEGFMAGRPGAPPGVTWQGRPSFREGFGGSTSRLLRIDGVDTSDGGGGGGGEEELLLL
jgi:hypothetical protein